ncbi:MAG: hypothetical protein QGG60_09925 [Anaerolineales bacterium]|jgi:hypothetical protein|nr:hypothetical protein [Anaerolineales bacterium]|tara:strand:+ start:2589 stop:3107 length:519 start_codon:yes stop_codon:yes gene_type:complete
MPARSRRPSSARWRRTRDPPRQARPAQKEGSISKHALFQGLIVNEADEPAGVAHIGEEAHYVINDVGFKRHVAAEAIDRAVLRDLRAQITQHQELVSDSTLKMLGQDDLFTKAMIDSSLKNIDAHMDQLLQQGLPSGARQWLGMLGFRIVVNHHGEVLKLNQPGIAAPDDEI